MKNSIFNTPYLIKGKSNGYERFSDVALIGPQGLYFKDGSLVETVLDECIYWLPNTLSSKWLVDRRFDNRIVAERLNSFELYARNIYRFSRKNNLIKNYHQNLHMLIYPIHLDGTLLVICMIACRDYLIYIISKMKIQKKLNI
jgi:hypothetical protein